MMNTQSSEATGLNVENGLVDWEEILDRFSGDEKIIAKLAGHFQEKVPELVEDVERAIAEGNSKELNETAHSLKGAISTFSIQTPCELALKLEQIGNDNRLAEAEDVMDELKKELTCLYQELAAFVDRFHKAS